MITDHKIETPEALEDLEVDTFLEDVFAVSAWRKLNSLTTKTWRNYEDTSPKEQK
tara:strand:+ start:537 stop:701 length:165 start_codon:yes stop_codon:yes gene_type:complete